MSISPSPFNAHPVSPETETRRARLVLAIAMVGICATLLAYAASPGVRHAVHSVRGAVTRALDHDKNEGKKQSAPAGTATTSTPASTNGATVTATGPPAAQKSP